MVFLCFKKKFSTYIEGKSAHRSCHFELITTKSLDELIAENKDLTYYTYDDTEDFQVGDKVKIWTTGDAQTSYPAQAGATKIEIVE